MSDDVPAGKRRGRPPMHSDSLQSEVLVIRFRVTKATADALYQQAIRSRKSFNEWMRDIAIASLIFRSQKNTDPKHLM